MFEEKFNGEAFCKDSVETVNDCMIKVHEAKSMDVLSDEEIIRISAILMSCGLMVEHLYMERHDKKDQETKFWDLVYEDADNYLKSYVSTNES